MVTTRKSGKQSLLDNPVGATIFQTSVPTTLGVIAVILYYLADTYFVSLLGTEELAALGFTFPATMLITYFGVGLGIGTSALVARAIGADNHALAAELTFASCLFGSIFGVLAIFPGIAAIAFIFPGMGATPELMPLIDDFMSIWLLGIPFVLLQFSGTSVIRASGNAKLHGIIMMASAVVNAILDPILIFGFGPVPAMGIGGAAAATVITWGLTVVIIMYYLYKHETLLSLRWPGLQPILVTWGKLMKISLPAACANMITPIATGILTATLATYGSHAVAAFGVISRVEAFIMIVVLGMSMSLPPFISQNFGAKHFDRVREGLRLSLRFVLIWQLFLFALVALGAPYIAAIFTQDTDVQEIITLVLRILPASYAFQGMVILTASCFNALHAPRNALITSLLRFFVLYVPLALLGSYFHGIEGLFWGAALGNLLAGLIVTRWINRYAQELEVKNTP